MNMQQLIEEAVSLPVDERAHMVDLLLRSLNPPESAWDQQWLDEAQRRLADLRSGRVTAVSGEDVFNRLWSRLEQGVFPSTLRQKRSLIRRLITTRTLSRV